jgi:hypothetical protein
MNVSERSEGGDARQAGERFDARMICGSRNARSESLEARREILTRSLSPSASAGPSRQSPYCAE